MTDYALVGPENQIDRVQSDQIIDPATGTKPGWRWLPVVVEFGEPYGDTVEEGRVRRGVIDPVTIPPPRRIVRKSVVEARVDRYPGKLAEVMTILTSNWSLFVRWISHDYPEVYFDDPDTLYVLDLVGLDPAVIMAEGND